MMNTRRHRRVEMQIRVECLLEDGIVSDFSRNLSEGGISVSSLLPVPEGATVELRFQLPDPAAQPVTLKGKVVWSRQESKLYPMGIEFEDQRGTDLPVYAQRFRELCKRIDVDSQAVH